MEELNNPKYIEIIQKEELKLKKPEESIDQNMTQKKLENLISKPYKKCKKYLRQLDRFENLKNDLLDRTDETKKIIIVVINISRNVHHLINVKKFILLFMFFYVVLL
jgi:sugar-specific transcriptional regulator TrmB